ncbi:MAG: M20/M25/M40 family metallo-hydrolase [Saprospiraceae bacterium]
MKFFLIILTCACLTFQSKAQTSELCLMQARVDLVYLSSDLLGGRATASEGEYLAAEYIIHRFKEIGLRPGGVDNTWLYPFHFKEKSNPHDTSSMSDLASKTGFNVIGKIDNGAKYTVIIGAHYDHLGMGGAGSGSLAANEAAIHNGADDNASGVAALLAIAEKLKNNPITKNNNYEFIAFSGEEKGLYGSNAYTKDGSFNSDQYNYMINLDMVGRLNAEKSLALGGVGTSPAWKPMLENNAAIRGFKISASESGQGPSDHTSFYLKNIPVLHFFTGQHKDYHKPSDDAQWINFEGLLNVANLVGYIIENKNNEGKLGFTKTKDESGKRSTSFKVTMGIMPDYLYQEGGIRLDGVTDNKPAANAGLKAGDIVLKIGDTEIKDMNSYMEVLGKHEKGEKVNVEFKRDGKMQSLLLTF